MGHGNHHMLDRLVFAVFLTITLISIYVCFISIYVERRYIIFDTEEQVDAALEINLLSTLRQLL